MVSRWPIVVGMNLLLGIPGIVPFWLLWFLAASWRNPPPTENDGMALWLVIVVPIVGLYTMLWWAANRALVRRMSLARQTYWLLSALGTFMPTIALILLNP